ncbi:MAG: T9SS type A sorting domain-containing protein [bacterium]
MKKLIPLLLVIISVSLHSQEPKYWEKIDFQFDSGIKSIIYDKISGDYYSHTMNPFLVSTELNKLYFFENYKSLPIIVNQNLSNINIREVQIIKMNSQDYVIFLISTTKKLFVTHDLGLSWEEILTEKYNIEINSIIITKEYRKYYSYYFYIATDSNGVFVSNDSLKTIELIANTDTIKYIEKFYPSIDFINWLTKDNNLITYYSDFQSWSVIDLSDYSNISNLKFIHNNFFFLGNERNIVINYDVNQDKIILDFSEKLKDTITAFNIRPIYYLTTIKLLTDSIPWLDDLIIGTKNSGIFTYNFWNSSLSQESDELNDKTISLIETDDISEPQLILVGTKEGELFYALVKPPVSVEDKSQNSLSTFIFPQPASTKTRLSFTLPMESRVSVQLFNTLGIEQFAIVDGFFSKGENSISLDVSGLADGMYFVAIQLEGKTVVEKLVVRR